MLLGRFTVQAQCTILWACQAKPRPPYGNVLNNTLFSSECNNAQQHTFSHAAEFGVVCAAGEWAGGGGFNLNTNWKCSF